MNEADHNRELQRLDREHGKAALHNTHMRAFVMFAKASMFILIGMAAFTYSVRANARDLATTPNKAGGEIVLTTSAGACPENGLLAYSRGEDGTTITGCWFLTERYVAVRWDGTTEVKLFTYGQFTPIEPAEKPAPARSRADTHL